MIIRIKKVKYEQEKYIREHNGKVPTKLELSDITGYTIDQINQCLELNTDVASLNSPVGENDHVVQSE